MKKILAVNIIMAALLALYIFLNYCEINWVFPFDFDLYYPLVTLNLIFAIIFYRLLPFIYIALAAVNYKSFRMIKNKEEPNMFFSLFGGIGAFISACIFKENHIGKGKIGIGFSMSIWLFVIYQIAFCLLCNNDLIIFPVD